VINKPRHRLASAILHASEICKRPLIISADDIKLRSPSGVWHARVTTRRMFPIFVYSPDPVKMCMHGVQLIWESRDRVCARALTPNI
jgi:hypothetical protein